MSQRDTPIVALGSPAARVSFYSRLLEKSQGPLALLFETIAEVEKFAKITGATQYTSKQSRRERLSLWRQCLSEKPVKIVGTRQAVFLPKLKLLAIDEPDRYGFRNDQLPHYHTLNVAIWRFHHEVIKLVIGSPALDCQLSLIVKSGARLIGRGPVSPIKIISAQKLSPLPGDLVVLPSHSDYGSFPASKEISVTQVDYLSGRWRRAWLIGFDQMLALPDYAQQEKIYLKIQRLRWISAEVLVSTANTDQVIFKPNFIDLELKERKRLGFPPFGWLVQAHLPNGTSVVHKLPLTINLRRAVAGFHFPRKTRIMVDPERLI